MSSRLDLKSRQTRARLALAADVESRGSVTEMPCTRCFRNNLACIMSEGSSRCSECIRVARSCDGTFVASSLTKLAQQQKKLEDEEQEAEEALFLIQTQLSTALNRLARLRRMKKVVKEKRSEAFRRGMKELDEVDAAEQWVQDDLQSLVQVPPDDFDWASVGLDPSLLAGEIPQEVPCSSEGAP